MMSDVKTTPQRWRFDAIDDRAGAVRLPVDRRDVARRKALVRRIELEYEEMPGLSLALAQAAKLFGAPPAACARILRGLVEKRTLDVSRSGRYIRTLSSQR